MSTYSRAILGAKIQIIYDIDEFRMINLLKKDDMVYTVFSMRSYLSALFALLMFMLVAVSNIHPLSFIHSDFAQ